MLSVLADRLRHRLRGFIDERSMALRNRRLARWATRLIEVAIRPALGLGAVAPFQDHFSRKLFTAESPAGELMLKLYLRDTADEARRGVRMHALLGPAGLDLPALRGSGLEREVVREYGFAFVAMERVFAPRLEPDSPFDSDLVFRWLARLAVLAPAADRETVSRNVVLSRMDAERFFHATRTRLLRAGVAVDAADFAAVSTRIRRGLRALDAERIPTCPVYVDCKPENFLRRADGSVVVVDLDGLGFGHPLLALAKGLLHYAFGKESAGFGGLPLREVLASPKLDRPLAAYFAEAPSNWRRAFDAHRAPLLLWSYLRMVGFAALRSRHPLRSDAETRAMLRHEAKERWARLGEFVASDET